MKTFKTYEDYLAFLNNASVEDLADLAKQACNMYNDNNMDVSFSVQELLEKATTHYNQSENNDIYNVVEDIYSLLSNNYYADFEDFGVYMVNYEENTIEVYNYVSDLKEELSNICYFEQNFIEEDYRLDQSLDNVGIIISKLSKLTDDQLIRLANEEFADCAWDDRIIYRMCDYEKVIKDLKLSQEDIDGLIKTDFNRDNKYFTIDIEFNNDIFSYNNLSRACTDLALCLIECNHPYYIEHIINRALNY